MKPVAKLAVASLLSVVCASSASAGDIIIGVGADNFDNNSSGAALVQLEVHSNPIKEYAYGRLAWMAVAELDEESDFYLGAGLSGQYDLGDTWFVEGSIAAGYYDQGPDGQDLDGNLQFRSLLGVGLKVSDRSRVSLAFDHLSNAGLQGENPGRNAVTLRYARSF